MTANHLLDKTVERYELASTTWDQAEYDALHRVIASGHFTMGQQVRTFEEDFAHYVGSRYAVMVNSGSSANLLMVAALCYRKHNPLKPGDEVIVPAVSWPTTYYPLAQYGLKLKFVDIDAHTLNYDLTALSQAVTDQTRCLMVVNLLGNPNDFETIRSIIGQRDIVLIEDNCESLGARFQGKQGGTFGVMGSYSSFFSHHISTMEGGLIATDDEELYHLLLSLRSHGWTRHLPKHNQICRPKSDNAFEEYFRFVLPGYNVRPGELHGALGVEQLRKLPDIIRIRRDNAAYFVKKFTDHPALMIQQETGESSWFGFSLIVRPEMTSLSRADVIARLEAAKIEYRPIVAGNFAKNEVCRYFDYSIHAGQLPNATLIDERGLFVGNHHYPIEDKIDYLYQTLSPEALAV